MRDTRPDRMKNIWQEKAYKEEEVRRLATEFLELEGNTLKLLDLRYHRRIVWVFRAVTLSTQGEEMDSWLVAGDLPYIEFSPEELKTPGDVLGMYAWFTWLWSLKKGEGEEGELPLLREIGTWEPRKWDGEYAIWLNERTAYAAWQLSADLAEDIYNAEVRNRLKYIGVTLRPPRQDPKGQESTPPNPESGVAE